MALEKDSWVDPHELALAIAEQQRERKNKALELRIAEKAGIIADVLGRGFCIDNCIRHDDKSTPPEYKIYQQGNIYQDNILRIETRLLVEKDLSFVRIARLGDERGLRAFIFGTSEEEVFSQKQKDGELEIPLFEKEHMWIGYFNSLYELACAKADFELARASMLEMRDYMKGNYEEE